LEMEKQEEVTLDEGNIATKLIEPTSWGTLKLGTWPGSMRSTG
jgi:hypothetical protein